MFRTKLFRMVLVVTILAALVAVPMAVGAQNENGFNLEDGATLSGVVDVMATTPTEGFERWELLVFPNGNDSEQAKIYITGGTDLGAVSYELDTTGLPDGDHVLALRVVRPDTSYEDYRINVTIDNSGAPVAVPVAEEEPVAEETPAATAPTTATVPTTTTVAAPTAAPAPTTGAPGFSGIEDGATLSGVVDVMATTPTEGFDRWELLVFPNGNDSEQAKIYVAGGTDLGAVSYELDTTGLPDGDHVLALRVVRPDTNYEDYRINVTIDNAGAAVAVPVAEEEPVAEETPVATTPTTATVPTTTTVAAPTAAPVVEAGAPGFSGMEDGATLSGVVDVMATTPTEGFDRWELLVFPNGNDSEQAKIYVAGGTDLGAVSYELDTTGLPDGDHVLALRVVRPDSSYEDYRINVTIDNAAA